MEVSSVDDELDEEELDDELELDDESELEIEEELAEFNSNPPGIFGTHNSRCKEFNNSSCFAAKVIVLGSAFLLTALEVEVEVYVKVSPDSFTGYQVVVSPPSAQ